MPKNRYEFVKDKFLNSFDHYYQFYVNLLFDRSIFIDRYAHISWVTIKMLIHAKFFCSLKQGQRQIKSAMRIYIFIKMHSIVSANATEL